jgi:Cu/Ag efflux protein CusF
VEETVLISIYATTPVALTILEEIILRTLKFNRMKSTFRLLFTFIFILNVLSLACTNAPTQLAPNNSNQLDIKTYQGVGIITKINQERRAVEINHEDIEGLMPAMTMEFVVKDRALLEGLQVGDKVNFTIEEKLGTFVISTIKKQTK